MGRSGLPGQMSVSSWLDLSTLHPYEMARVLVAGAAPDHGQTMMLKTLLKNACRDLEALWVGGLALLLLFLGSRLPHAEGEGAKWVPYLLLGTVFPALLTVLCLLRRLEG